MKKVFFWLSILSFCIFCISDIYHAFSVGLFVIILVELIITSSYEFAFRHLVLLLYAMNYLLAPAITYNMDPSLVLYKMKIPSNDYFELALPGFLLFCLGMFLMKTKVFVIEFNSLKLGTVLNESFLKNLTIVCVVSELLRGFVVGELNFVIYLFAILRFVTVFALISIKSQNWVWLILVMLLEILRSFLSGMYHDTLLWLVFFGLFYSYLKKPSVRTKLLAVCVLITFILFTQALKFKYRNEVWLGQSAASLETVYNVGLQEASYDILFGSENLLSTLNRGNQAWIFASTVDHISRSQNFQGMSVVNEYIRAAILPRFLAPDKIQSGDRKVFNEFSGHFIESGTSMGLGIFADGYVAYGANGVYLFGFGLGLLFSITFRLVERWSTISSFYALLLLPLLNYAVRPDCELQTTINHLFKGLLFYGFLVYISRKRFSFNDTENRRLVVKLGSNK